MMDKTISKSEGIQAQTNHDETQDDQNGTVWLESLKKSASGQTPENKKIPSIPYLLSRLQSPDIPTRKDAVEKLWIHHERNDQIIQPLITLLNDPDAEIRRTAVWGLVLNGNSAVVKPLISTMGDPATVVVCEAAKGLGQLCKTVDGTLIKQAVDPLINQLTHPDPEIRRSAAISLGQIGQKLSPAEMKVATNPLLNALHDPVDQVRAGAASAFVMLGNINTLDAMLDTFLHDPDAFTYRQAAQYLQNVKDVRCFEPIVELVKDLAEFRSRNDLPTNDWHREIVRKELAIDLLGSLGDRRAGPILLALVNDSPGQITHALAAIGDPVGINLAMAKLSDPDPLIRFCAIQALSHYADPQAIPLLEKMAQEDKEFIHYYEWVSLSDEATSAIENIKRHTIGSSY
jgi:HEAT repeat protein